MATAMASANVRTRESWVDVQEGSDFTIYNCAYAGGETARGRPRIVCARTLTHRVCVVCNVGGGLCGWCGACECISLRGSALRGLFDARCAWQRAATMWGGDWRLDPGPRRHRAPAALFGGARQLLLCAANTQQLYGAPRAGLACSLLLLVFACTHSCVRTEACRARVCVNINTNPEP
jgi:hypothetical protein